MHESLLCRDLFGFELDIGFEGQEQHRAFNLFFSCPGPKPLEKNSVKRRSPMNQPSADKLRSHSANGPGGFPGLTSGDKVLKESQSFRR
jgi:hypothetical protein